MRINIPKKIPQNFKNIAEVWVEYDNTEELNSGELRFNVPKIHFEKMDFVNMFDFQWENCSFVRYRVKYLDGREEVLAFESKEKAVYEEQIARPSLEINFFEDALPFEQKNWKPARVEMTWRYAPDSVLNTELLSEEDLARLTATVNFPETGVLSLKNGLISEKGLVYASTGKTRFLELTRFSSIAELSKDKKEINIFLSKKLDKLCKLDNVKYFKGKALNLYTFFSNYNFCHSFLDVAALLNTAKLVNLDLQSYDYYVVPENNFRLVKELFNRLAIDRKKFLHAGEIKAEGDIKPREYSLLFDQLDTPSFDGVCGYYAPGAFDFLRYIYDVDEQHKGRRRIYLSREEKGRGVLNEKELLNLLEYYDFEILHSSYQLDIPRIMSETAVVIGAHGAAMANCVFCSKKSTLIDLIPQTYTYPYYMSLANSIGFKYHAVISRFSKNNDEKNGKIIADIPKIKCLLDDVCYE